MLWLVLAVQEASCESCHTRERVEFAPSVHAKFKVSCIDCHGGSAAPTEDPKVAHAAPFAGKPAPKDVAAFCGRCHSDVALMNPHGLRTDQEARYRVSGHGRAILEGATEAATCVSCHGHHDTTAARDPQSPVHPLQIASTCGKCHADAALMKKFGHDPGVEAAVRTSVHGRLLYERGDLSAPTCVTCHDNHGAAPPGLTSVGLVCGRCHVREAEQFAASPHAAAVETGLFDTCVTCHGNHAIAPATDTILRDGCATCHGGDDKPLAIGATIRQRVGAIRAAYARAEGDLTRAAHQGLFVDEERALLKEAYTYMTQLPGVVHSLNADAVEAAAGKAGAALGEIDRRLAGRREELTIRKLALIPIAGFFLLMAAAFALKLRRVKDARRKGAAP